MAPLTWRNVDAPDFRGSLQGLQIAQGAFDKAFSGFGDGLGKFREYRQEEADAAGLRNAIGISDPRQYAAALASGSLFGGDPSLMSSKGLAALDNRAGALITRAAGQQELDQNALMNPERFRQIQNQNRASDQTFNFNEANNPTVLAQGRASLAGSLLSNAHSAVMNPLLQEGQRINNNGGVIRNQQGQLQLDESKWKFGNAQQDDADNKEATRFFDNMRLGAYRSSDALRFLDSDEFRTLSPGARARVQSLAGAHYGGLYSGDDAVGGAGASGGSGRSSAGGGGASGSAAPGSSLSAPSSFSSLGGRSFADVTIGVESGGKADARNNRSSATGQGQFIDDTWLGVVDRIPGLNTAGMTRQQKLDLRTDPRYQAEAINILGEDNGKVLVNANLPDNAANRGLSHFLGGGGAVRVLRSDRNMSVAQALNDPAAITANPQLANMTVGQLVDSYRTKYEGVDIDSGPVEALRNSVRTSATRAEAAQNETTQRINQNTAALGGVGRYMETQASNDDALTVASAISKELGADKAPVQNVIDKLNEIRQRTGGYATYSTAAAILRNNLQSNGLWDREWTGSRAVSNNDGINADIAAIRSGSLQTAMDQNTQLTNTNAQVKSAMDNYNNAAQEFANLRARARNNPRLRDSVDAAERRANEAARIVNTMLDAHERDRRGAATRQPIVPDRPAAVPAATPQAAAPAQNAGATAAASLAAALPPPVTQTRTTSEGLLTGEQAVDQAVRRRDTLNRDRPQRPNESAGAYRLRMFLEAERRRKGESED